MQIAWNDMTEAQKEEANETAYASACDRLRSMSSRYVGMEKEDVRRYAHSELLKDISNFTKEIKYAERTRATRMDKSVAEYAKRSVALLALVEGFIWDAEI